MKDFFLVGPGYWLPKIKKKERNTHDLLKYTGKIRTSKISYYTEKSTHKVLFSRFNQVFNRLVRKNSDTLEERSKSFNEESDTKYAKKYFYSILRKTYPFSESSQNIHCEFFFGKVFFSLDQLIQTKKN